MSASFLITWERLPARPAALALSAPSDTSRRRTAGGREFRVSTKDRENQQRFRLSNLIRILLLQSSPGAGNCGRLAALHPCALPSALYYPKDRRGCTTYPIAPRQSFTRARMAWVLEFFRACRPVRFARVHLRQEPSRGLFERLSLLCWSLRHVSNHDGRSFGIVRKSFGEIRNV